MFPVNGSVVGDEGREQVAVLDAVKLRYGSPSCAHHLTVLHADPDQAIEEALAVQDLSGTDCQHVAVQSVHLFDSLVADFVKAQGLACQHERIHVAQVPEILFCQAHPL